MSTEAQIEQSLLQKLADLKYALRPDIRNREMLERNFREKFEALNRCNLSDAEFAHLRDEIITSDVFAASRRLRETNTFQREDGTPLQYTLVNIKDWCKNEFEVVNQLRINTENSHHRYDVILLLNGLPLVQIELKTYEVSPRNAMQQIVNYKNDPGSGIREILKSVESVIQIICLNRGFDGLLDYAERGMCGICEILKSGSSVIQTDFTDCWITLNGACGASVKS